MPSKATPLCIFWNVGIERNMLAFDNVELLVQRLKNSFVCNLWSWSRVFVDVGPTSLISFINWQGSKRRQVKFFVLSLPHLVKHFGSQYILLV